MKIMSWNVRGLGDVSRRRAVREMLRREKVQIALIQESKLKEVKENLKKKYGAGDLQGGCQ